MFQRNWANFRRTAWDGSAAFRSVPSSTRAAYPSVLLTIPFLRMQLFFIMYHIPSRY